MSCKRNHPESNEVIMKKAKFIDKSSSNELSMSEKGLLAPECQTNVEDREPQSHGEETFRANNPLNDDTESELSDLHIDCFDDFDSACEPNQLPVAGPMGWIQTHIKNGTDPRHLLQEMLPPNLVVPEDMDTLMIWKLIFDLVADPQPRQKLPDINTLHHVLDLLKTCRNILVLTGAGVSVSCGIPDFRSRDGIYARLSKEYPDLPDPQAMFDICYFRNNIKPFYKFAKEIYPGQFKPSLSHRFIHHLEKNNKLLRNYTQNIDTLEREAGITRVIECHGSFSTASCTNCRYQVTSNAIRNDILNQETPLCPKCPYSEDTLSVMKPDIVFFGESLPETFYDSIQQDINKVDLLIIIGSSLKVRPVNLIPNQIPADVPQILINREPLPSMNFDVELLGDCDTIIAHLCKELDDPWSDIVEDFQIPSVSKEFLTPFMQTPPDSPPNACCKEVILDDGLEKKCYGLEKNIENGNSLDELHNEDKDVTHIFLPPCRYIFHGAEIGRCDSPVPFEDEDEESDKSDCSSEVEDGIEHRQSGNDGGYHEHDKAEESEHESVSEIKQNEFVTNTDSCPSLGLKDKSNGSSLKDTK